MAAFNGGNAAQQFVGANLRIALVEPIPPGDPIGGALVDCPLHHSVGEQAPIAGKQYDIAGQRLLSAVPAYGKYVARPHRRQHAASGHSQAQFTM
jgi:hypothetical protein